MTKHEQTNEELEKASHSAEFLVAELRTALNSGTPVEAEVLLPLISDAAKIRSAITRLRIAREANKR